MSQSHIHVLAWSLEKLSPKPTPPFYCRQNSRLSNKYPCGMSMMNTCKSRSSLKLALESYRCRLLQRKRYSPVLCIHDSWSLGVSMLKYKLQDLLLQCSSEMDTISGKLVISMIIPFKKFRETKWQSQKGEKKNLYASHVLDVKIHIGNLNHSRGNSM